MEEWALGQASSSVLQSGSKFETGRPHLPAAGLQPTLLWGSACQCGNLLPCPAPTILATSLLVRTLQWVLTFKHSMCTWLWLPRVSIREMHLFPAPFTIIIRLFDKAQVGWSLIEGAFSSRGHIFLMDCVPKINGYVTRFLLSPWVIMNENWWLSLLRTKQNKKQQPKLYLMGKNFTPLALQFFLSVS